LLPSPLFDVQNAHGSPGLAANVVPYYVVLKGVSRQADYFPPRTNISGSTTAVLGDDPRGALLRWLRVLARSSRTRPISKVKYSLRGSLHLQVLGVQENKLNLTNIPTASLLSPTSPLPSPRHAVQRHSPYSSTPSSSSTESVMPSGSEKRRSTQTISV